MIDQCEPGTLVYLTVNLGHKILHSRWMDAEVIRIVDRKTHKVEIRILPGGQPFIIGTEHLVLRGESSELSE